MTGTTLDFRRTIRDPIYGYIPITELENAVIDSPAFQRLDRISQMHSVHLVYPNAKYSRKCHSLGVMHLAHQAIGTILYRQHQGLRAHIPPIFFREAPVELMPGLDDLQSVFAPGAGGDGYLEHLAWVTQCVRLAGLLHDVGHGPFSHLFEHACSKLNIPFNHELMSQRIVREVLCAQEGILDPRTADFVCHILGGQEAGLDKFMTFLHQIISGPMACDVLDYIARDSYHAGTREYGQLDVTRLLQGLVVRGGELKIEQGHLEALMSVFHALLYLYDTVYYHKTCRTFDIGLLEALVKLKDRLKAIAGDPAELLEYDDFSLLHAIKSGTSPEYVQAFAVVKDFMNRRKRFSIIADCNLNLKLHWVAANPQEFKGKLNSFMDEIRNRFPNRNLFLDFRPLIRSVGLKPEKATVWLKSRAVWSKKEGRAKSLGEVKTTDLERLRRMHVPVRVFIPIAETATISEQEKEDIKRMLERNLTALEDSFHGIDQRQMF